MDGDVKYWVDPPSGWRYGFPKIYDTSCGKTIIEWLVEEGYPQEEINFVGRLFYCRRWSAEDESSN